jgi:hypothetical protein
MVGWLSKYAMEVVMYSKSQTFLIVLLIFAGSFLVACAMSQQQDKESMVAAHPAFDPSAAAIYFTINDDDKHVNVFEKLGALVATSSEELTAAFDEYPELQVLYIGENSLNDLDKNWLEEVYREGVLIVAINEPASALGSAVNVRADLPDIDFSYAPEGFIVVTAFKSLSEPTASGTRGYYAASDYFATVEDAVNAITHEGEEFYLPPENVNES